MIKVPLQPYEEEILRRMYDNDIIGWNYKPIEKIAKIIKWRNLATQYKIKANLKQSLKT